MAKKKAPSTRETDFRAAIAQRLEPLGARLQRVLAGRIKHTYPKGFWRLDFEVHVAEIDRYRLGEYFYRKGFDQVFDDDPEASAYPLSKSNTVIDLKTVCPGALLKSHAVTDDDDWVEPAVVDEIVKWFQTQWLAAGGARFPHLATLAGHDASRRLDLVRGRWKKD